MSKNKPDKKEADPGKSASKRKKAAAPKKKKTAVDSSASAKRFLCGCALPVFFLVFIFGILLYLAGIPVLDARVCGLPDFLFYPANQLTIYVPWYYEAYERVYAAAGGTATPFERGSRWPDFRAVQPGDPPVHWVIHEDYAEVVAPAHLQRVVPYGINGRDLFLQQFRTNGEYKDNTPVETVTTYRAGLPVRLRRCPLENGYWMFDCTVVPVQDGVAPFTGWFLKQRGNEWYSELYLAGKKIAERFFVKGVYDAGFSDNPLYQYQFTRDQKSMLQIFQNEIIRKEKIPDDLLWGRNPKYSPDSLMVMAVRKSDYSLLTLLLRKQETVREMNARSGFDDFSLLHEAAIQGDPRVLGKLLPFFHSTQLREKQTGATPFLAAVSADRPDNVLIFLRREDCRINDTLNDGRTALHLAVENGSFDMVSHLLRHGAAKGLKDKKGHTPLHLLNRKLKANPADADLHRIREILE